MTPKILAHPFVILPFNIMATPDAAPGIDLSVVFGPVYWGEHCIFYPRTFILILPCRVCGVLAVRLLFVLLWISS
jgi:hypothetical protein